ncbi:MAG: ABC transporter permease, partial [Ilumatobacteraceae bacterium]
MIFFPLLFLTPNFVPRDQLTRPMEIAATINPVTYVMEAARSLILEGFEADSLAKGFGVVAGSMLLMLAASVRMVNNYD